MPLLFGYGSLINRESVARTLKREIHPDDLRLAHIEGYRRTWTASIPIQMKFPSDAKTENALFLDLSQSSESCNGVLLELSDHELTAMDLREKGYQRIDVIAQCGTQRLPAETYIVPETAKSSVGAVLEHYVELIETGLSHYRQDFSQRFWSSTDPIPKRRINGEYQFRDPHQSAAAGR